MSSMRKKIFILVDTNSICHLARRGIDIVFNRARGSYEELDNSMYLSMTINRYEVLNPVSYIILIIGGFRVLQHVLQ